MKNLKRTRVTCWAAFLPGGDLKTSLSSGISDATSSFRTKPLVIPPLQTPKSHSAKANTKRTENPRRNAATPMDSISGWLQSGFRKWVYVMEWEGCEGVVKLQNHAWRNGMDLVGSILCGNWESNGIRGRQAMWEDAVAEDKFWEIGSLPLQRDSWLNSRMQISFEEHPKFFHILMEENMHFLERICASYINYMSSLGN